MVARKAIKGWDGTSFRITQIALGQFSYSCAVTLSPKELGLVGHEIAATLVGQPVQKVVQPDEHTLLLSFPSTWLRICVHSRFGRVHLDDKPRGTGESAPAFCMLLRKHLQSARLVGVELVAGERVCAFDFERRADNHKTRLLVFLFGRAAQIVLVDENHAQLGTLGAHTQAPRTELPPARAHESESRFTEPFSPHIAEHYRVAEETATVADARKRLAQGLTTEKKRCARLVAGLTQDLARADRIELEKKWADLIFANLALIPRHVASVTLPDAFTDGSPIEIPLDPAFSAKANAERFYKNVRRFGQSKNQTMARRDRVLAALQRVEESLARIDEMSPAEVIAEAAKLRSPVGAQRGKSARDPVKRLPYNEYVSEKGVPIWVGRGAERNDELTFKIARGADLWLHTRDVPGAHVVVPLSQGADVDAETLVDAATLAAHHSVARDEPQVDITYTLRKHVRRVPKGKPGQVILANAKTLRVRMEPVRLERLLRSKK